MHKKEDNVVFVLQKAISHFKIKVTATTVKEFLLAHPYYPTLKSVCDALAKWKVKHYALNLELEEIKTLEMPYLAHLNVGGGKLAFVEKTANNQVTYFIIKGKRIEETFEKFAEKISGAVVVMEAGEDSGEKEYRQNRQNEILNKSLLPFGIITLAIIAVLNFVSGFNPESISFYTGLQFWGLVLTKITGLTASIFLILHELKISTPIADKICGFSSKTDCDTVLSSSASKVFGWLNWADVGLIYFTGTIIYLLGINDSLSLGILTLTSILALPYPVFSIYYQAFKAKKWCPFCLTVQLALVAEFVILLPFFKTVNFAPLDILNWITFLLISGTIWLFYKSYFERASSFDKEHYSFLGFKRNPEIFKFLLQQKGYIEIPENKESIILGNPEAPVIITAFLSLHCNPCAYTFKKLKTLLDDCKDVKINAVFSVHNNEESFNLINHLYFLYNEKGPEAATEFLYKWYSTDTRLKKLLYEKDILNGYGKAEEISKINKGLFDAFKIAGTPTVYVQGFKFPTQFNYEATEFYIDDIKKLNMESQRQEACANCH
jgi:uncharacterized membrane protein